MHGHSTVIIYIHCNYFVILTLLEALDLNANDNLLGMKIHVLKKVSIIDEV